MIFPRLSHFSIILLVLLCVVSAMGSSGSEDYRYLTTEDGICISFKHPRNLTDCCNRYDPMQRIYTLMTGPDIGIYHSGNLRRILCYNEKKGRYKIHKRGTSENIRNYCSKEGRHMEGRHKRNRRRHRHRYSLCPLTRHEREELQRTKPYLKCELHEKLGGAGFAYLSAEENAKYLAVRHRRVQRLIRKVKGRHRKVYEPRKRFRQFIIMSAKNMRNRERCGR